MCDEIWERRDCVLGCGGNGDDEDDDEDDEDEGDDGDAETAEGGTTMAAACNSTHTRSSPPALLR